MAAMFYPCDLAGSVRVVPLCTGNIKVVWNIERIGNKTIKSGKFNCLNSRWNLIVERCSTGLNLILYFIAGPSSLSIFLRTLLEHESYSVLNGTEFIDGHEDKKLFTFGNKQHDVKLEHVVAIFSSCFHPDDTLTFRLELEPVGNASGKLVAGPSATAPTISAGIQCLVRDVLALFTERKNCDITLKVGDKEFPAHTVLLGARSRVFAAMFEHDMEEKRSGFVDITDLSSDTLNDLLIYIYSGDINNLSYEEAFKLYDAAEKYELKELQDRCADVLVGQLCWENACDLALFGDTYSNEKLVDSVKKFVCKNPSLLATDEWTDLVNKKPQLATKILLAVSSDFPYPKKRKTDTYAKNA